MTNFTLIIPHHNLSSDLFRCLTSIPKYNDIEVIVIDDTSSEEEVNNVKKLEKKFNNYKFIYTQEGKGAGHARNLGLEIANGKWILFVDCDDLLIEQSHDLWKSQLLSESDIIYFRNKTIDSETLQFNNFSLKRDKTISRLKPRKKALFRWLRTCYTEPWGKMFRREFLIENNINFEESLVANDYYFSIKTGLMARKIEYCDDFFYLYSIRNGSLSNNQISSSEKIFSRLKVYYNIENIFIDNDIHLQPFTRFIKSLKNKKLYTSMIDEFCNTNGYPTKFSSIYLFKSNCRRIFQIILEKMRLPFTGF